jgi:transcriptional regulator with XRE-family HTH domain
MDKKTPSQAFGENLRYLRRRFGTKNGREFAKKLGIKGKGTKYYYYEQGHLPDLEMLMKIVDKLNVSFDLLFKPFLKEEDRNLIDIINRVRKIWESKGNQRTLDSQLRILEERLKEESSQKDRRAGGGEAVG